MRNRSVRVAAKPWAIYASTKPGMLTLEWTHVSLDHGTLTLPDSKTGRKTITLNKQAVAVPCRS